MESTIPEMDDRKESGKIAGDLDTAGPKGDSTAANTLIELWARRNSERILVSSISIGHIFEYQQVYSSSDGL
jgi:hypothetical protein